MTNEHAPPSGAPAPNAFFAAMLRGAIVPTACSVPVVVVVFLILRGSRGGLSALFGAALAAAFFGAGLYVMKRTSAADPIAMFAGAMAVYLGQVLAIGIVILAFRDVSWLDGPACGIAILAIALVWQVFQGIAYVRTRKPVYDLPTPPNDADGTTDHR